MGHGPFKKIEDLLKVPGVPEKTFEIIKDLITLTDMSSDPQILSSPTPSY
jgi:hypothetical protein